MDRTARIAGLLAAAAAAALLSGCAGGVTAPVRPAADAAPARADAPATNDLVPPGPPAVSSSAPAVSDRAAAPVVPAQPAPPGPGEPVPSETSTQSFDGPVRTVTVSDDAGNVTVTGAGGDRVVVVRKVFTNPARPTDQVTRSGGDLKITAPYCKADDGPRPCRIDYEIQVPRGIPVTLTTASGNLSTAGLTGQQSAVAASGNVHVSGASGPVTARSSSGNVEVTATAAPPSLVAASVSGNASVVVPPGRYRVETATTSGDRDVSLASDPAASSLVQVTTVSGNLRLGTTTARASADD